MASVKRGEAAASVLVLRALVTSGRAVFRGHAAACPAPIDACGDSHGTHGCFAANLDTTACIAIVTDMCSDMGCEAEPPRVLRHDAPAAIRSQVEREQARPMLAALRSRVKSIGARLHMTATVASEFASIVRTLAGPSETARAQWLLAATRVEPAPAGAGIPFHGVVSTYVAVCLSAEAVVVWCLCRSRCLHSARSCPSGPFLCSLTAL